MMYGEASAKPSVCSRHRPIDNVRYEYIVCVYTCKRCYLSCFNHHSSRYLINKNRWLMSEHKQSKSQLKNPGSRVHGLCRIHSTWSACRLLAWLNACSFIDCSLHTTTHKPRTRPEHLPPASDAHQAQVGASSRFRVELTWVNVNMGSN